MAVVEVFEAALALPADERLKLAAELLASVEPQDSDEWEAAWSAELAQRLADEPTPTRSWAAVRAQIENDLARK